MKTTLSRVLGAFLLCCSALSAQAPVIHINGSVWDGQGGPFVAGTVYHIISNGGGCCMNVPAGRTLTIQKGAMVKLTTSINVQGNLVAKGVVFTSWHDDSVGGDSNQNGGATTPARGDWSLLELGGTALLEDCKFNFAGRGGKAVHLRNGTMTMRRCEIEDSQGDALLMDYKDGTVSDCKFSNCDGIAINGAHIRYVSQLTNNSATNCAGGDYVRITNGIITPSDGTVVLDRIHSINQSGVFVMWGTTTVVQVRAGANLVLPKGTTLKIERGRFYVDSNLTALGTPSEPIVMTSLKDDSFGGDTNKDGNATQPKPGEWQGLQFVSGAGASRLDNVVLRFGGASGSEGAGIAIHGSAVEVRNSVVDSNLGAGFYFRGGYVGYPRVVDCLITNNETVAGKNVSWQTTSLCSGNTASGNGGGDYFILVDERSTVPLVVGPENYPGGALVVATKVRVGGGGQLDLEAGTILKFSNPRDGGFSVSQQGALRAHGTAVRPVVMTSLDDDSFGGDTNGNGNATSPQAGQWGALWIGDDRVSAPSLLENVLIRYSGRGGVNTLQCGNSKLSMRSVRLEHIAGRGMEILRLAGNLENMVVWDAALTGIKIHGGSYDIVHATVVDCGGIGMEETHSAYSGKVRSSIVWNNTGGNFGGSLLVSEVLNTNGGFAGSNGNINQAPQFVNQAQGDLRLSAASPCLGMADFAAALAVKKDFDEHSRVLDPSFSGLAMPDMGAYERWTYSLKTTGQPQLGTTMTFKLEGPAGLSTSFLGFLNGGFFLGPFGIELAGVNIFFLGAGAVPVGQAMSLSIPNIQSLVGLNFGVQGLALPASNPGRGSFSNLYRSQVY